MSDEVEVILPEPTTEAPESSNGNPESPPKVEQPPVIDYRALYMDTTRELNTARAQLESRVPARQEDPTDYNEMVRGEKPADAIRQIIQSEIRASMGDLQEFGQSFKAEKLVRNSEETVFRQFPQLEAYRTQLAPMVRNRVALSGQTTADAYQRELMAVIGEYAMQTQFQPTTSQPETMPPQTKPTAGRPPASSTGRRLSEAEKTAMRRARLDPTKAADIAEFQRLISDEAYSV